MALPCNKHIEETLRLAEQLMALGNEGIGDADDDGCLRLYGVIRDGAFKIRAHAEREREAHKMRGIWDGPEGPPRSAREEPVRVI